MAELGICVPKNDRFYSYFSVFDFECILSKENLPANTSLFRYKAVHVSLRCSVASPVPDFRTSVCFVPEGDLFILMQRLIEYLEQISTAAFNLLKTKFQYVFNYLPVNENVRSKKIKSKIEKLLKKHIVLGFNSGSYDLNLPYLFEHKSHACTSRTPIFNMKNSTKFL